MYNSMKHQLYAILSLLLCVSIREALGQTRPCDQKMSNLGYCVRAEVKSQNIGGELPPTVKRVIMRCFTAAGCQAPSFRIDPTQSFPPTARLSFQRLTTGAGVSLAQKDCIEKDKRRKILEKLQSCTSEPLYELPDWENDDVNDKTKRLKNLITIERGVEGCPEGGEDLQTCIDKGLSLEDLKFCSNVKTCAKDELDNNCQIAFLNMQDEVCDCADQLGARKSSTGDTHGSVPDNRQVDRFEPAKQEPSVDPNPRLPSEPRPDRRPPFSRLEPKSRPGGEAQPNPFGRRGFEGFGKGFPWTLGSSGFPPRNTRSAAATREKRQDGFGGGDFDFGSLLGSLFGGVDGGGLDFSSIIQGFLMSIDPLGLFGGMFGDVPNPDLNVAGFGDIDGVPFDDRAVAPAPTKPPNPFANFFGNIFGNRGGGGGSGGPSPSQPKNGRIAKIKKTLGDCGVNSDQLIRDREMKLVSSCGCARDANLKSCLQQCTDEVKPFKELISKARKRQRKSLMCRMQRCFA